MPEQIFFNEIFRIDQTRDWSWCATGGVLNAVLYILYTSVSAVLEQNLIATFSDDTDILVKDDTSEEATNK